MGLGGGGRNVRGCYFTKLPKHCYLSNLSFKGIRQVKKGLKLSFIKN